MNTRFPTVPNTYSQHFYNQFVETLRRYFSRVVSHDEEAPHIILRAPNGTLWQVSVTDAGVLQTSQVGHAP